MPANEDKPAETTRLGDETFMTAEDLQTYMDRRRAAMVAEDAVTKTEAHKARDELIAQLSEPLKMQGESLHDFVDNLKMRLTAAAEHGETEILMLRFPNALCTDHGRAINNEEPDWPDTLTGRPRQFYEIWRDYLHKADYQLKAMVIDWPDGMPGDIGMYLSWKRLD